MQLTSTEIEIVKKQQVGATAKQLLAERERYHKWDYPKAEREILAIKQKAIACGEWFTILNEQANSKNRTKGGL